MLRSEVWRDRQNIRAATSANCRKYFPTAALMVGKSL